MWHKGLFFKLSQSGIFGNLLDLLSSFLRGRKLKVVLNDQIYELRNVAAGVPKGFILGPLLFLIYINDFSGDLSHKANLFADDASLLSVTHDVTTFANELNNNLKKIIDWVIQWKISFNPGPCKQAQKVFFSRKLKKRIRPSLGLKVSKTFRYFIRFQINF